MEIATRAILNEIRKVISFDGAYVNYRHISTLVDVMTFQGFPMSITRHGINRRDVGPLMKCTFEETCDILLEAAAFAQKDDLKGVSENVMMGKLAKLGTGVLDTVLNIQMLEENDVNDDKDMFQDPDLISMFPKLEASRFTPLVHEVVSSTPQLPSSPLVGEMSEFSSTHSPSLSSRSPAMSSPSMGDALMGMSPAYSPTSPAYQTPASPSFGTPNSPGYGTPATTSFRAATSPAQSPSSLAYQVPTSPSFRDFHPSDFSGDSSFSPPHEPPSSPCCFNASPSYGIPTSPAHSPSSPGFSPPSPPANSPTSPIYLGLEKNCNDDEIEKKTNRNSNPTDKEGNDNGSETD